MDRYLKEIIKNLEIKENYIDNEGSYIEYIETKELNKIFNNVISKQKVKDKIEEYFEDEEWLIEHDLRALCDDEKECREYYINKKIALKDIKKNILDKLNKLLNNY